MVSLSPLSLFPPPLPLFFPTHFPVMVAASKARKVEMELASVREWWFGKTKQDEMRPAASSLLPREAKGRTY